MLLAALLGSAQAGDPPQSGEAPQAAVPPATPPPGPPALEAMPARLGYAFERPEILLRQRLFGLAHGLSLLAASCLDLPQHSEPIQDAYAVWHARQARTIEALVLDLARYYFGARAAEAQWQDLARALNLKDSILPALGETSLQDACASLPEAIARPRYELDRLLAEAAAPTEPAAGPLAVPGPASEVPVAQGASAPTRATPAE